MTGKTDSTSANSFRGETNQPGRDPHPRHEGNQESRRQVACSLKRAAALRQDLTSVTVCSAVLPHLRDCGNRLV